METEPKANRKFYWHGQHASNDLKIANLGKVKVEVKVKVKGMVVFN